MSENKTKILVIEDDKFLREIIAGKLNKEGYEVFEAGDGEEGIKKIKEERPGFILLDLVLPGIDGFEVLNRIKQDSATASIPVIVLSNLGQRDDMERALKLGVVEYLIKANFGLGEIVEKIKKTLESG